MRSPEQKFSQANYMSSLKSALCGKDASLWGGGGWGGCRVHDGLSLESLFVECQMVRLYIMPVKCTGHFQNYRC